MTFLFITNEQYVYLFKYQTAKNLSTEKVWHNGIGPKEDFSKKVLSDYKPYSSQPFKVSLYKKAHVMPDKKPLPVKVNT